MTSGDEQVSSVVPDAGRTEPPPPSSPRRLPVEIAAFVATLAALAAPARAEEAGAASPRTDAEKSPGELWKEEDLGSGAETWEEPAEGKKQEFFEEEEEKPPAWSLQRPVSARRELVLEYRSTDVFDEPPDPNLGPPPDEVWYLSYSVRPDRVNYLMAEAQAFAFDDPTMPDSGYVMLFWERTLSSGARLDLEAARQSDSSGRTGLWGAVEYGWPAGLNAEISARLQLSSSLDGVFGWRAECEALMALDENTALRGRAWYYRGHEGSSSARLDLQLARYLGRQTALHLLVRSGVSESGDPDEEIREASSAVGAIELRHRFGARTLARVSYRWYSDSEGDVADGYSVGAEHDFGRCALGAFYRGYWTNEGTETGTWWIVIRARM